MCNGSNINWEKIKVFIFDVDGTLYNQSKLRRRMFYHLLAFYVLHPWRIKDVLILYHFRSEREKRCGEMYNDLENTQYKWCAEKTKLSTSKVKRVVDYWIFQYPNQYLLKYIYPGLHSFLKTLKHNGFQTAIYSDYKALDKLKAMKISADLVIASTDTQIDRLKPDPKGLIYIANKLKVNPNECLFIGDRQELDGVCAIKAKMPYLIFSKKDFKFIEFLQ